MRYTSIFLLCTLLCVAAGMTCYVLGIVAFITGLQHWDDPCDVPLGKYSVLTLLTNIFFTRITNRFHRFLWRGGIRRQLLGLLVLLTPQVLLCILGVALLIRHHQDLERSGESADALCDRDVYSSARNYIFALCVISVICGIFLGVVLLAVRYVVRMGPDYFLNMFGKKKGCFNAVQKLPEVPFNAEELKDDEDGLMQECTICLADFDAELAIVRTPCAHLFHKTCLGNWCKGSLSCPLCREPIGPADEEA